MNTRRVAQSLPALCKSQRSPGQSWDWDDGKCSDWYRPEGVRVADLRVLQQEFWSWFKRSRESLVAEKMEETKKDSPGVSSTWHWNTHHLDVSGVVFLVHLTLGAGRSDLKSYFWAQKDDDLGHSHWPHPGLPRQVAGIGVPLPAHHPLLMDPHGSSWGSAASLPVWHSPDITEQSTEQKG